MRLVAVVVSVDSDCSAAWLAAYARFFVRDKSPDAAAYSVILAAVHVKAQEGKHMGGTARDLQALGKLVKAIRQPNADTIAGSTPVVLLGDFNQDCGNRTVFERILNKGWVPLLPPGHATNALGDCQYDNVWINRGGAADTAAGYDRGLLEAEPARVLHKPPEVDRQCYSNHCLVHSRICLLRSVERIGLVWQDPLICTAQLLLGPSLTDAYKGSLKAALSQIIVPSMVQYAQAPGPRLRGMFGSMLCCGSRWHCLVVEDEDQRIEIGTSRV